MLYINAKSSNRRPTFLAHTPHAIYGAEGREYGDYGIDGFLAATIENARRALLYRPVVSISADGEYIIHDHLDTRRAIRWFRGTMQTEITFDDCCTILLLNKAAIMARINWIIEWRNENLPILADRWIADFKKIGAAMSRDDKGAVPRRIGELTRAYNLHFGCTDDNGAPRSGGRAVMAGDYASAA